jgi:hypothetical protein
MGPDPGGSADKDLNNFPLTDFQAGQFLRIEITNYKKGHLQVALIYLFMFFLSTCSSMVSLWTVIASITATRSTTISSSAI